MRYISAAQTQKGIRKQMNQDSILLINQRFCGRESVLAVICDGIGGLADGEVASREVVRLFEKWFLEKREAAWDCDDFEDELYDSWEALLQSAHHQISSYRSGRGSRMGTTATVMLLMEKEYYIAHVGDGRIYEIMDEAVPLTRDQTIAGLAGTGGSPAGEAADDKASGILLQGIGASEKIRPVYTSGCVKDQAVYLLCSDGFRHRVERSELVEWFSPGNMTDEKVMTDRLSFAIKQVESRGEKDDISGILIRAQQERNE